MDDDRKPGKAGHKRSVKLIEVESRKPQSKKPSIPLKDSGPPIPKKPRPSPSVKPYTEKPEVSRASASGVGRPVSKLGGSDDAMMMAGEGTGERLCGTANVKPKRPTSMMGGKKPTSGLARQASDLTAPSAYGGDRAYQPSTTVSRTRTSFDRELLEWDLLAAWEDDLAPDSNETPNGDPAATSDGDSGSEAVMSPVPDTFRSADDYVEVWFPLLLQEMRAQTLAELQTEGLGQFTKVSLTTDKPGENKLEMLRVTKFDAITGQPFAFGDKKKLRDCFQHDLVLLVQDPQPILEALGRNQGPKPATRTPVTRAAGLLGIVNPDGKRPGRFLIRVHAARWTALGKPDMFAFFVTSLVSSIREITALLGIGKVPLLPRLLNGDKQPEGQALSPGEAETAFEDLGDGFIKMLTQKFNPSQIGAIKAAASKPGFTLIKGPPGTGKTSTLKGLLNSLHLREYQRFYKGVIKVAQADDHDTDKAWARYSEHKPHILVTAPSNVAVDNIVLRIIEDGFTDGQGARYNPAIVRIGRGHGDKARIVSLDTQVDEIFSANEQHAAQRSLVLQGEIAQMGQALALARSRLRLLIRSVKKRLPHGWHAYVDDVGMVVFIDMHSRTTQAEFPTHPTGVEEGEVGDETPQGLTVEQLPEYIRYSKDVTGLAEAIETKKLELRRWEMRLRNDFLTNQDSVRQELESNFFDSAHLVFTTLNSAGSYSVQQGNKFNVVVVDEAAQAIEPSTLIPLQTGPTTCVLVGDPQQLPATVFSHTGSSTAFERSLFERLEHGGHAVHLLDTQYRMHPKISAFPRQYFYSSELKDGQNVSDPVQYSRPWHNHATFQPFTFLDLKSDTDKGGASYRNPNEARLIVNLYQTLKSQAASPNEIAGKTGVITPYSAQLHELHQQFQRALGPAYQEEVEINTVDGYQGKEKDVILFSCVRAGGSKGIGFLADVRRMNVGLTRGRLAMLVVGRQDTLARNKHWRALLDHAKATKALVSVPSPACNLLMLQPWDPSNPQGGPSQQQHGQQGFVRGRGGRGPVTGGRGGVAGQQGRSGRGGGRGDGMPVQMQRPAPPGVMPPQQVAGGMQFTPHRPPGQLQPPRPPMQEQQQQHRPTGFGGAVYLPQGRPRHPPPQQQQPPQQLQQQYRPPAANNEAPLLHPGPRPPSSVRNVPASGLLEPPAPSITSFPRPQGGRGGMLRPPFQR